jgi:type II secretory pathway component GspD/PulD (secretin)
MKRLILALLILLAGLAWWFFSKTQSNPGVARAARAASTISSLDRPQPGEKTIAAKTIKLEEATLGQVLDLYAETSGRSIIRGTNLPEVKVTFSNQTPMTRPEVLQALDTVLAAQGITMVALGTQYAKVVTERAAGTEVAPIFEGRAEDLPDSSSLVVFIVNAKTTTASQAAAALAPFAKLPNSLIAIPPGGPPPKGIPGLANLPANLLGGKTDTILILRDYAANVRRMLQVLEKMEER